MQNVKCWLSLPLFLLYTVTPLGLRKPIYFLLYCYYILLCCYILLLLNWCKVLNIWQYNHHKWSPISHTVHFWREIYCKHIQSCQLSRIEHETYALSDFSRWISVFAIRHHSRTSLRRCTAICWPAAVLPHCCLYAAALKVCEITLNKRR